MAANRTTTRTLATTCCIAGGGPAGMMLGLLLARAGIAVIVLEKHADFLRDFRGDTIHPSTLEIMHELGLVEGLLKLPHQKAPAIKAQFGDMALTFADFSHLPTHCKFIALMPQWDFLNFLAGEGKRYAGFTLMMRTTAGAPIEEGGRIVGLRASDDNGELEIRADLVIGADGRHSTVRDSIGAAVESLGAPMDVLWFRLTRRASDTMETIGRFDTGRIFIMLNRGEHWQCAFVIAKGSFDALRTRGLPAFRDEFVALAPFVRDRVGEIASWDDVKLLTVAVDRLTRWYRDGLLCIGDAAHAMSPIGGVGINLAIQDAVAAANILAVKLRARRLSTDDLRRVQRRREFPTRWTQRLQLFIQDRVITQVLGSKAALTPPLAVRLLARYPALRRIPGRLVGIGIRPEHVRI